MLKYFYYIVLHSWSFCLVLNLKCIGEKKESASYFFPIKLQVRAVKYSAWRVSNSNLVQGYTCNLEFCIIYPRVSRGRRSSNVKPMNYIDKDYS